MSVSRKEGDTGYTSVLNGEWVPNYQLRTEASATLEAANSFLGRARASAKEEQVKRVILQVQRHFFLIGAEASNPKKSGHSLKKTISEIEVNWLNRLVEKYEKALDLSLEFVAFGREETSSPMDVARATVRKAERTIVKMKNEDLIENDSILKYLSRLSDLIFLLARFEEKEEKERREIKRIHFPFKSYDFFFQKWAVLMGSIIVALITVIILLLIFHGSTTKLTHQQVIDHLEEMMKHRAEDNSLL